MVWKLQDAKARFSEFLEASLTEGPQVITRRGIEVAVLVPIEHWRTMERSARPTLKQLLLAPEPRFELRIPKRKSFRLRSVPTFRIPSGHGSGRA